MKTCAILKNIDNIRQRYKDGKREYWLLSQNDVCKKKSSELWFLFHSSRLYNNNIVINKYLLCCKTTARTLTQEMQQRQRRNKPLTYAYCCYNTKILSLYMLLCTERFRSTGSSIFITIISCIYITYIRVARKKITNFRFLGSKK